MDIKNRMDFLYFLKDFISEIETEDFDNKTLKQFIAAMESWIEDMDGYYENTQNQIEFDETILTWRMLADILQAAKVYE